MRRPARTACFHFHLLPQPNSRSRLTHTLADCEYVEGPLVKLCRAGFKACWSRVYQPISTVVVE